MRVDPLLLAQLLSLTVHRAQRDLFRQRIRQARHELLAVLLLHVRGTLVERCWTQDPSVVEFFNCRHHIGIAIHHANKVCDSPPLPALAVTTIMEMHISGSIPRLTSLQSAYNT